MSGRPRLSHTSTSTRIAVVVDVKDCGARDGPACPARFVAAIPASTSVAAPAVLIGCLPISSVVSAFRRKITSGRDANERRADDLRAALLHHHSQLVRAGRDLIEWQAPD